MDVVLSSGFLAFASHCGFLAALEDEGIAVEAGCGTSSGALTLALWAAGVPAEDILHRTTSRVPLAFCTPHLQPWRGVFRLDAMMLALQEWLPADFWALRFPISVGVVDGEAHALLSDGPLVPAVAASCAVPGLFVPVQLAGRTLSDGAARDRFGLEAFRAARGERPLLVHAVDRTGGSGGEPDWAQATVVRSPRSGASLLRIPSPEAAFARTRRATREALARREP